MNLTALEVNLQLLDIYVLLAHVVGVFVLNLLEDIEGMIEIFYCLGGIFAQILDGGYVDEDFRCAHLAQIFIFVPSFNA